MRILSMIATFGKLDNEQLVFKPGLNVIQAPNEWGKSTWCAFLTMMLYGVDTRERSTRDTLADKEKYAPWSGRPMEGLLRIEYEGRDITIQRRTRGRTPMGEFTAFETKTGLPVPELTAENCGQKLLGVERSVYLRTGFLRGGALAVKPDETLRHRLQTLVTTGEEGNGPLLEKKLKELKNRCASPRGGLIPEVEGQIKGLEEQIDEHQFLKVRLERLEEQTAQVREEIADLERHRERLAWQVVKEDPQRLKAAAQNAKRAQEEADKLEEECAGLPEYGELEEKLCRGQELMEELQQAPMDESGSTVPMMGCAALGILALVGAGVLAYLDRWAMAAGAALGGVVLMMLSGALADRRRKKAVRGKLRQMDNEKHLRELVQRMELWKRQKLLLEELERAERTAVQARLNLEQMVNMVQKATDYAREDKLDLSEGETEQRLNEDRGQLRQWDMQLGQCQGRLEQLPQEQWLRSRLEEQRARLAQLNTHQRALELALESLEEAQRILQRRFAPRITKIAQGYFQALTDGKYQNLTVGDDLAMMTGSQAETTLRGVLWRSDGTADQMYLALRLAVWSVLNPHGPLVMDDALIRLDDGRLEKTMELLSKIGQERQILLFSCQGREKAWMERNRT